MCGRYTITSPIDVLRARFGFVNDPAPFPPRYNLAPMQEAPVVIAAPAGPPGSTPERRLGPMRWGLVPYWAKDASGAGRWINARSESSAEKPAFREALRRRRCLVVADGFFEWQARPGTTRKQPILFYRRDREPFAMAGVWERWRAPDGQRLHTFAILTTRANALLAPVHDRMPVILTREGEAIWLDHPESGPAEVSHLLLPLDPEAMASHAVSTAVGSPANDSPELILPISGQG